ncbi:DMT family transporter [Marinomonas balearica]|uniref:Drug/metabolite transporter (DMT)-like permease n=1 Tax=Marinomonas balearica TaxID=491947 RepID=A0A4V3CGM7_9GAMM|nr:DMT family transporter [Marinomonas balearica]TDO98262.1 drug/metabolite transporter (DMT)-like permease [Marinomonas balearica]
MSQEYYNVRKGIFATITYAFIMSIAAVGAKHVQTQISVAVLVFWQSLFCVVVLFPQMRGKWEKRSFDTIKIHILRSVGGFVGFLCYYWALNEIPLVEASLLRSCAPLCVPFVVLIVHKIFIPKARWVPLLVGFVGVALVIHPTPTNFNPWHIVGFLSAVGLAFSMITTRMLSTKVSSHETMIVYFSFSAACSLIMALAQGDSIALPVNVWGWVLAVSGALYVGMYLYTLAYTSAPASLVSPVSYVGIAFSGFWGWVIWGHVPDAYAISGTVLIFLSVLLSASVAKKRA